MELHTYCHEHGNAQNNLGFLTTEKYPSPPDDNQITQQVLKDMVSQHILYKATMHAFKWAKPVIVRKRILKEMRLVESKASVEKMRVKY